MMLVGLTEVPEDALKLLLQALHHERIDTPLSMTGLSLAGLQSHAEPLLRQLRGLDRRALMALIACVIAERRRIGLGS